MRKCLGYVVLLKILSMENKVSNELKEHYAKKFKEFGATPKGVDWGKEEDMLMRFEKMVNIIDHHGSENSAVPSLLDVGCGYAGLLTYAIEKNISIDYTGIDVVKEMIDYSKNHFSKGRFFCKDVLEFTDEKFDYVVCNGILTQKLNVSIKEMDVFAKQIIKKMFSICNKGIAFNIMSDKVNFMVDNLYYKNPVEMFAFCLSEISEKVMIDHSYPLYEYTVYIYKR